MTARPPDDEHDWLTAEQAGARIGVTRQAIHHRLRRGTLPVTWNDGRPWIRADLLELRERARRVQALRPVRSSTRPS